MRVASWLPLAAFALLTACPWAWATWGRAGTPQFTGTDERAKQTIGELRPGYRPWIGPVLQVSHGAEAALFAGQALFGVALVVYSIASCRHLKAQERGHASRD